MNKQSLYGFGGSLLATTALATSTEAATLRYSLGFDTAANVSTAISSTNVKKLSTQVFGTSSTANTALVIGGTAGTTSNTLANSVFVNFAFPISMSPFRVDLDIVGGAVFSTPTPTVVPVYSTTHGGSGSITGLVSISGCSIQPTSTKIIISGCNSTGATSVGGILIEGISFSSASGLATAGTSIQLSGSVKDSSGSVIDSVTQVNYITSSAAVTASISPATSSTSNLTISSSVSPAFTALTVSGTTATTLTTTLGSVAFSSTNALSNDLSTAIITTSISGAVELKIAHDSLSSAAMQKIQFVSGATSSLGSAKVTAGTVSFQIPAGSLDGGLIQVVFDGLGTISATTGTATATVTPSAPSLTPGTPATLAAFSSSLAQLTAGGMNVSVNTVQPRAGAGSTLYQSYLRVVNTSTFSGLVTFTVTNDVTGAAVGSFTSAALTGASAANLATGGLLKGGATLQISSADIEAAIPTAAATGAPYKVQITGAFNGYVQNMMLNTVSGIFSDLSGFRNGGTSTSP